MLDDGRQFSLVRRRLLNQPTLRQSQVARSAASANHPNDQADDTTGVESVACTNPKDEHSTHRRDRLFIHYTHEKRFRPFKRDMHRVYEDVFRSTPAMNVKLVVGNRNRRDAMNELIRKRPKRSLLTNSVTKRC